MGAAFQRGARAIAGAEERCPELVAQANIRILSKTFQPAAVGAGETTPLFQIKKGERVLWASAIALTAAAASTDTTFTLGDGVDPDGYIAAVDLEATTAGTHVAGAGALLANSGGKYYTGDDTVDAVYAGTTFGATNPKMRFTIAVARDWLV